MTVVIRAVLTLREGQDDDLIKLFKDVPARKRASFIIAAMRSGGLEVKLDDLPDDSDLTESMDAFLM